MPPILRIIAAMATMVTCGAPALAGSMITEECNGTETIQTGNSAAARSAYKLTFKADLSKRTFCYASCTAEQTYPISDIASSPIKLVNLDKGGQIRLMTFDIGNDRLTDYQVISLGKIAVTRKADAVCKASKN